MAFFRDLAMTSRNSGAPMGGLRGKAAMRPLNVGLVLELD